MIRWIVASSAGGVIGPQSLGGVLVVRFRRVAVFQPRDCRLKHGDDTLRGERLGQKGRDIVTVAQPPLIVRQIQARARTAPHAPAILSADGQQALSYQGLSRLVDKVAATLAQAGLGAGDRVALWAARGPMTVSAFLGLLAHLPVVPIDPSMVGQLPDLLQRLSIKALVAPEGLDLPQLDRPVHRLMPTGQFAEFRIEVETVSDAPPALDLAGLADPALVIETSGTTGRPKVVELTQANLAAGAQSAARTLALAPGEICVNPMPLFHVHGLCIGTLATIASGGTTVPMMGGDGALVLDACAAAGATWYTAVPTIHHSVAQALEREAGLARGVALRFIRSSSAALASVTRDTLQRHLGCPVLEGMGMTEAASWVAHQPYGPGPTHGPLGPAQGTEIAILTEAGEITTAPFVQGELVLRGPNVITRYDVHPGDPSEAFHDGWLRSGDLAELNEKAELRIHARLKELINRGGAMVSPVMVEAILLEEGAVAAAIVFGAPHPSLGQDVLAAVVPADPAAFDPDAILQSVARKLPAEALPRSVFPVSEIPLNRIGKPARIEAALRLQDKFTQIYAAPRTPLEAILVLIIEETLGRARHGRHDDFFLAGGDSLSLMRLQLRIEEDLGVLVPGDVLTTERDVARLSAWLETHHGETMRHRLADVFDDAPAASEPGT
ncbi:non-ribosomal peptide synthetase [Roseicyclus elongatus]|uniref:non-ribosomal peptide synthetase n=1 Tax=Roseicyclus elongatus TaxID=159346 RepID=UPI0018DD1841|nr:non-ribosomal peptide synthetase [Roseibacterium elongatum]